MWLRDWTVDQLEREQARAEQGARQATGERWADLTNRASELEDELRKRGAWVDGPAAEYDGPDEPRSAGGGYHYPHDWQEQRS